MALNLIHSNQVEKLHDELCHLLISDPLDNPFISEIIVCPSPSLARWVDLQFALKQGIAANFDYPLPASWVWQLAAQILENIPQFDPLQGQNLAWKIYHSLSTKKHSSGFEEVNQYLMDDSNSLKQWALAQQAATVFENYQHYRPDFIQQWNQNKGDHWQAILWSEIKASEPQDRVSLINELINTLNNQSHLDSIPKRVSFFSVSSLPPLVMQLIQSLSQLCDVYIFILSPCEHYWGDLINLKQVAKKRLINPEINEFLETGHELLASWGRQGMVFQDLMLSSVDESLTNQYEAYIKKENTNTLGLIQNAILELDDSTQNIVVDDSIKINRCYSAVRECEVLHDQCLALIEHEQYKPEDILVLIPDIERYSSVIESVFKKSTDEHKPFIPWNISDNSYQSSQSVIRFILDLLALPKSRLTLNEIIECLDCDAVLKHFSLTDEDKHVVHEYAREAHVNWAYNDQHKSDFELPKTSGNTWQSGQNRIMAAYSMGGDQLWNETLPLNQFSGSRTEILANLFKFLDALNYWRNRLKFEYTAIEWQHLLNQLCESFVNVEFNYESVQMIRDVMDELVQFSDYGEADQKFSVDLIEQYLKQQLTQKTKSKRYFSGGITFCGLRPMRSVPFKVIAILGLNENEFPRQNKNVEFDLSAKQWRPGDIKSADEDRYLFLEALLCAREHLILSYCHLNPKNNALLEPSLMVSEFIEYCNKKLIVENDQTFSKLISQDFPIHSFNRQNFKAGQSYSYFWCDIANQIAENKLKPIQHIKTEFVKPTDDSSAIIIDLNHFKKTLAEPVKNFYNQKLGIKLFEQNQFKDDEPIALDGLEQWQIRDLILSNKLENHTLEVDSLKARGVLPHGSFANENFVKLSNQVEAQLAELNLPQHLDSKKITLKWQANDSVKIAGEVQHWINSMGLLHLSASKLSGKAFINGWIDHLLLCVCDSLEDSPFSALSCQDAYVKFLKLTKAEAQSILEELIQVYKIAQAQVIPLFSKTSFIYQYENEDIEKAYKKASEVWLGGFQKTGEVENPYLKTAFSEYKIQFDGVCDEAFKYYAHTVYQSALDHSEIRKIK